MSGKFENTSSNEVYELNNALPEYPVQLKRWVAEMRRAYCHGCRKSSAIW